MALQQLDFVIQTHVWVIQYTSSQKMMKQDIKTFSLRKLVVYKI